MPTRLTVIMNQNPPASPAAVRMSEEIVGELIGRPGIDLSLVDASALGELGSTDQLMVSSITGDFAYLDWKAPERAMEWLRASGVDGERSPHPLDREAGSTGSGLRRVFLYDLGQFDQSKAICDAIYGLLKSRQTRTFALSIDGSRNGVSAHRASGGEAVAGSSALGSVAASSSPATPRREVKPLGPQSPTGVSGGTVASWSDQQLEALVDQLNDEDLG